MCSVLYLPRLEIHSFQKKLYTNLISHSGGDLARGADTWGSIVVRAEAERRVDQEEQPWRGRRLQQLQPGEPRLIIVTIKIVFTYLNHFGHHHDMQSTVPPSGESDKSYAEFRKGSGWNSGND